MLAFDKTVCLALISDVQFAVIKNIAAAMMVARALILLWLLALQ